MLPWRRKRWFDEFLSGLDEEFRDMEKEMSRVFEEAKKRSLEEPSKGGPYVYGFSMRVGPDGKPHIEEFGNVPEIGVSGAPGISEEREPLTDVIERDKNISVIFELPGIEKDDINLNVSEDSLSIDVDSKARKYRKDVQLPCKVKSESAKATYKNGVLEVKIDRVKEKKKEKGVSIKVE